jgi:hypothetical protein
LHGEYFSGHFDIKEEKEKGEQKQKQKRPK